jgi:hypothetical protein
LLTVAALLLLGGGTLLVARPRQGRNAGVAAAFDTLRHGGRLADALDLLERAAATDSAVLRNGHQLAHALGRLAVVESHGDASVVSQCRPDFASGCYHGVVEAFVQARGRVDMAELERMCAAAGGEDAPGPVHECVHGLGHGVLGAVGDLGIALHHCGALEPDLDAWCRDGAFMEAMSPAMAESESGRMHEPMHHSPLYIDAADPYSPCDRFDGPDGTACWVFQGFLILRAQGFDTERALHVCDGAPADRTRDCYASIGLQVAGLSQRDDAWIIGQCARGRPALAPDCAAGAARALVQMDWSGERAARFCGESPPAWKDACYQRMGAFLADLAGPARRGALCERVEPGYGGLCRRAVGVDRST